MNDIRFSVPLTPRGKERPRATVGAGGGVRVYAPPKTREWETRFLLLAEQHMPDAPIEGPLEIDVVAVFPRTAAMRSKKHANEGLVWMPQKPDADNVIKIVLDALRRYVVDDAQFVRVSVSKARCEFDGLPRVAVRIRDAVAPPNERALLGLPYR